MPTSSLGAAQPLETAARTSERSRDAGARVSRAGVRQRSPFDGISMEPARTRQGHAFGGRGTHSSREIRGGGRGVVHEWLESALAAT